MTYVGEQVLDKFNSTYLRTNETTVFEIQFNGLQGTKTGRVYSPFYNGYLGIRPYSFHVEWKEENFMYKLKMDGIIGRLMAAFYIRHEDHKPEVQSSIKFGGYDEAGFKDLGSVKTFKTQSVRSWALKAYSTHLWQNENTYSILSSNLNLLIDPQLPYLYLPDNAF